MEFETAYTIGNAIGNVLDVAHDLELPGPVRDAAVKAARDLLKSALAPCGAGGGLTPEEVALVTKDEWFAAATRVAGRLELDFLEANEYVGKFSTGLFADTSEASGN